MNVKGTAIIKEGQYINAYELGLHKGSPALVQVRPIQVYRDNNKDKVLDYNPENIDAGLFGCNIHSASDYVSFTTIVDRWSAGCIVIADKDKFNLLYKLCQRFHNQYHDPFTLTLLHEEQL